MSANLVPCFIFTFLFILRGMIMMKTSQDSTNRLQNTFSTRTKLHLFVGSLFGIILLTGCQNQSPMASSYSGSQGMPSQFSGATAPTGMPANFGQGFSSNAMPTGPSNATTLSRGGAPGGFGGSEMTPMGGGSGALGGGSGALGSGDSSGAMGGNPQSPSPNTSQSSSTQGSLGADEKPVVVIAHGMGANGSLYGGLSNAFKQAGYETLTPSSGNAFDTSHVTSAINQTGDRKVILVGHSAGGSAVQRSAAQLSGSGKVLGVISIDGAPANQTDPNIPHAFFRHSSDGFGGVVGNANPQVPTENMIGGGVQTLPGGHITAVMGSDAQNYVNAAQEIEQRAR